MNTSESADDLAHKKRRHRNERVAAGSVVAALVVALIAFIQWNAREQEAFERERTYIPVPTQMTPEAELLREYVRIDTRAGKETDGARWLRQVLARHGVSAELIESAPGRGNVYARIKGRTQGGALLLLQHIDVAAADPKEWKHDPFEAVIENNVLHGRGALDMKAVGLTHLLAFIDVARSGRVPRHDIVFLATADEEQGGRYGLEWLIANRPDVLSGVEYALNEGGLTELKAEQVNYFGIEVGGKQFAELIVEADTAEQLSRARLDLEPLFTSRTPDKVVPAVRRFFRDIAPARIEFRHMFANMDAAIARGEFWQLPEDYRALTQNSVWMSGPQRESERHRARLILANVPGDPVEERIRSIERMAGRHGVRIAATVHRDEVVEPSDPDTPLFRMIAAEAERTFNCTAGTLILGRSSSDSRFLRQRGITAYGVQPFRVDVYQSQAIHAANERVRLDWFQQGIGFMRRVVAAYAFGAK